MGFLTLICRVDYSILISRTSPFPFLGMAGILFHFYLIFDRNSCKQTVKTDQMPRSASLSSSFSACLCPNNGALDKYWLILPSHLLYAQFIRTWQITFARVNEALTVDSSTEIQF